MSTQDPTRSALRAALHAVAPALRIKPNEISRLTERLLAAGVGVDSFGGLAMTAKGHGGQDVTQFIEQIVRRTDPEIFLDGGQQPVASCLGRDATSGPRLTTAERRARASDRLARSNGDAGPKL